MTSSTASSRSGSSALRGTSNATCFSPRVRLARTMRCATVASCCRKARAISVVVRPPSRRRVSATRDSIGSTGWQAANSSRSRSSPISSSANLLASSPCMSAPCNSSSMPNASCLRACSWRWRTWSIPRCLAACISQAAGLSGMPSRGQRSSAVTNTSCASSSATSMLPVIRASRASSLGDSMRHSASSRRWRASAFTGSFAASPGAPLQACTAQPMECRPNMLPSVS